MRAAKRRRSRERNKRLLKRARQRAGYTIQGQILKRVQKDLEANGFNPVLQVAGIAEPNKAVYPGIALWIHEVISIRIHEDLVVITPHRHRPFWEAVAIRLADPRCFEMIVEKMIGWRERLKEFKEEQAQNRKRIEDARKISR